MNGLEIVKHAPSSEDDRGRITKYLLAEPAEEVVVVERKKGTVSGNHYHKGLDPSKNPESLYLVKGKVRFKAKNLETGEETEEVLEPLTEVRTYPRVYHRLEALQDCIFLEVNKKAGAHGDLFRMEE
ncbi:MAG: hypothetical protein ABH834_04350 [Candidatus Altiarchaeota archaeon]